MLAAKDFFEFGETLQAAYRDKGYFFKQKENHIPEKGIEGIIGTEIGGIIRRHRAM